MAFGLRVTRDGGEPPGVARATARAAMFMLAVNLGAVLFGWTGQSLGASVPVVSLLAIVGYLAAWFALFGPARRVNGYLAFHDRWTRTRVGLARHRTAVATGSPQSTAGPSRVIGGRIGPFGLVESAYPVPDGVRLGLDERLRRHVWIRMVAPGAPPMSAERRDLARPTRLRWLGGKRGPADADNWDAYEAPDGEPFSDVCKARQMWGAVRGWLSQLSEELDAAALDGTGGERRITDFWVTRSQELKVLDFGDVAARGAREEQERSLVLRLAVMALEGRSDQSPEPGMPGVPLPLRARECLADLLAGRLAGAARSERLRDLVNQPTSVTRAQRTGPLLTIGAPLLFLATILAVLGVMLAGALPSVGVSGVHEATHHAARVMMAGALTPEVADLSLDLALLTHRLEAIDAGRTTAYANERRDLEIVIAGRFDDLSRNPRPERNPILNARLLALVERVAKETGRPDDAGLREADQRLLSLLAAPERFGVRRPPRYSTMFAVVMAWSWSMVGAIAALTALFFSGGLMFKLAGVGLVTSSGAPASRARCLGRALIAWSPVFAAGALLWAVQAWASQADPGWLVYAVLATCLGAFLTGAAAALRSPGRGWQDRLAGTHLVPR